MKNSFNFIKEISLELGISPVVKDGSILISENLLSVITRGDDYVLVSFPLPDDEVFSAVSVVSEELKTLIIMLITNVDNGLSTTKNVSDKSK